MEKKFHKSDVLILSSFLLHLLNICSSNRCTCALLFFNYFKY